VPQFQQADFHLQQRIGHSTVSEILPFLFYNKSLGNHANQMQKGKKQLAGTVSAHSKKGRGIAIHRIWIKHQFGKMNDIPPP
jgi:hypothetical protein